MQTINLEQAGLSPRASACNFALYTSLSWTGRMLVGEPGCHAPRGTEDLCEELALGAISVIVGAETGSIHAALAHHGDGDFPEPASDEQLMLITASPMQLPPKSLNRIAEALTGGEAILELEEVQRANALHFLQQITKTGIGRIASSVQSKI